MQTTANCLTLLRNSRNDNERMAALYTLAKCLNNPGLESVPLEEVFLAIGASFLQRLLHTVNVPDQCSEYVYKSVAMGIISRLATCPRVLQNEEFHTLLPEMNRLLVISPSLPDASGEIHRLVSDCYDVMTSYSEHKTAIANLIKYRCITTMCDAIRDKSLCWGSAQQLLFFVFRLKSQETWINNLDGLNTFLDVQCKSLPDIHKEDDKYFFLSQIYEVLCTTTKAQVQEMARSQWVTALQETLFQAVQRKLAPSRRDLVLKMSAILIDLFGISWAMAKQDTKFLQVVVNLCCIEVRVILEEGDLDKAEKNGDLLVSCFELLEQIVTYMSSGCEPRLSQHQMTQLYVTLKSSFTTVVTFIGEVATHQSSKRLWPMVLACVRVMGVWMAEETLTMNRHLLNIVPFMLKISKETFQISLGGPAPDDLTPFSSSLHEDSEAVENNPASHRQGREKLVTRHVEVGQEVLRFMLPGLCHMSADDKARKLLLEERIVELLVEYFNYQHSVIEKLLWAQGPSTRRSTEDNVVFEEAKAGLNLVCGVILNLTVMEGPTMVQDPIFINFMTEIVQKLPQVAREDDLNVVTFNLLATCLMSLRFTDEKELGNGPHMELFYETVTRMLFCHIGSDVEKPNTGRTKVRRPLNNAWDELQDLWFLSMQGLSVAVTKFFTPSSVIVKAKVLEETLTVLKTASTDKYPDELIVSGYKALLTELSTVPQVKPELLKCGGIQVAEHLGLSAVVTSLTN